MQWASDQGQLRQRSDDAGEAWREISGRYTTAYTTQAKGTQVVWAARTGSAVADEQAPIVGNQEAPTVVN